MTVCKCEVVKIIFLCKRKVVMNLRITCAISLCLLFFTSCRHTSYYPPELVCAEMWMKDHPDSALMILKKHSLHDYTTTDLKARYALLFTQAIDKNYMIHTSDSLIRIAVHYYDSIGDAVSQSKAHYYWGRVYQDKDDIIGTVREFLTAVPLAEKSNDYDMICLLKSNLGYLLWDNGLLEEADSLYRRVILLEFLHHDKYRLSVSLIKRADIAMQRKNPNYVDAEKYLWQAFRLANKIDNMQIRKLLLLDMSYLYERTDRPRKAIVYARRGIALMEDSCRSYGYYLTIGSAYADIGRDDSAIVYLKKSLYADNYYTKESAYKLLVRIASKRGKMKQALSYNDNYLACRDSILQKERPIEVVSSIKDMLRKQSATHYESFLHRYRLYLYIITGIMIAAVFVFVYKRKRKNSEIRKLVGDKQKQLELNNSIENQICKRRQRRRQLEKKLESARSVRLEETIAYLPIYKLLLEVCEHNRQRPDKKKLLTEEDWQKLSITIDNILPDYTKKIRGKCKSFSNDDIRFCYLLRLNFKYYDIAFIMGCSRQAVYKRRNAMMKRMGITDKNKFCRIIDS